MAELKPCPFCGRKPSKVKEYKAHYSSGTALIYYSVSCRAPISRCIVKPSTGLQKTPQEAIEAWNRRVGESVG